MSSHRRVLVYLKNTNNSDIFKANFLQSVLNNVHGSSDTANVYCKLHDGDQLQLSASPFDDDDSSVKIKRPSFCPIHNLPEDQIKDIPEDILVRGIDTGAVVLLESADGKILLTRRAKHLRTFPGIWVPPGGHIEYGESLQEAGLRELYEETGLTITEDMCVGKKIDVLAMWESVYPARLHYGLPLRHHLVIHLHSTLRMPFTSSYMHKLIKLNHKESVFPPLLSMGLPKRHHIVTYLYVHLSDPFTSEYFTDKINLDPEEVGACAWLEWLLIQAIVSASEEGTHITKPDTLPQSFSALIMERDGSSYTKDINTSALLNTADGNIEDKERVSTGTKFALSEWLQKKGNT